MLDSLPEISTPMKAAALFLMLFVAVALATWLVRRYGSDRFGGSSSRGRQPRLAVVDETWLAEPRRKLVIIRRDNVEHLLIIGGPTDVVIEQNIVRAVGAPRDKGEPAAGRGLSASETLARTVPLGEGSMWPLQPQAETNGRMPRTATEDPLQWTWPTHPDSQRPDRSEPLLETPDDPGASPHELPLPTAPAPSEKSEKNSLVAESDQTLADLASRLELSPRGPIPAAEPPVSVKSEPMAEPEMLHVATEPRIETSAASPEQKPARAEIKSKAVFESLEEEMANLLGRPPGKP